MGSLDETILRTSKEIIVKFIEMGRISPVTFSENFKNIYHTVNETVKKDQKLEPDPIPETVAPKKKRGRRK